MKKIYVGNLAYQTSKSELEDLFSQFGAIEDVIVITDRDTGRSKGFGFIEFDNADSANKALSIDGQELDGRPLKVSMAKERTQSGGGRRH